MKTYPDIGLDLAVLGSVISCIGVLFNNIILNHILAMQIWAFSNPILLVWAYGNWKRWWDGGISGMALFGMYSVFTISNLYGVLVL